MKLNILILNCQMGMQAGLGKFLERAFAGGQYDFLLLQETTEEILSPLRGMPYRFLEAFNPDMGSRNQLTIAYRDSFTFREDFFLSFSRLHDDLVAEHGHPAFGFLCGRFEVHGKTLVMGSLHLRTGMYASVRSREMAHVKKEVLRFAGEDPFIFGGDCNFGVPGERRANIRRLAPEISCITPDIGGTLDSRYSEYADHLPYKISRVLAQFGIGIKLRADNAFSDAATARNSKISYRILPDRVSDHSPIELSIE